MQPSFATTVYIIGVKVPTIVGGKETFCKIQTSKTALSLYFGEFFNKLF